MKTNFNVSKSEGKNHFIALAKMLLKRLCSSKCSFKI